jgi:predicted nucleic acid-binding protein
VAVKWFSAEGEAGVAEARKLLDGQAEGAISLTAPDLIYYELANVLVHKKGLATGEVQQAMADTFTLGLEAAPMDSELMNVSVELARNCGITVYDACYAALARKLDVPLVTANPRHQSSALGCKVLPL